MRTRKKPSKRSLIKKLQNGGTGDPKKPVVTQSATGFPLYREFGELTATPTTPFYTTTDQRGYYQGIPIGLPEAEVVADSGDALGSVDRVVEELGGGIFGDYAAIPASDREKFEGGVRDAINEGSKIAAIATSPLLAVGAAPILASGLQGYSALSQLPLITVKGQTAVTVGGGLDALGVGLSAKFLPQHIQDFKDDPSLGNAAFIGLDLLGFLPAGNAALQSYRQGLRAMGGTPTSPITLASGESRVTQAALEGSKVRQASLSMNNVIKNEIAKIDKLSISPAEKQKAIDETLEFYNNYLSNPAALEKIVEQKEFLEAVRQARTGDISALLGDIEVPMAPFESAGEASVAAVRFMQNPPFFSKFGSEGQLLDPDMNLVRNMTVVEGPDGALEARVDFFSNTVAGRRLSAEALLDNFRTGSQSAKNVILRTMEDMKRAVGGEARGAVMPRMNITGRTEMVGGVPLTPEISGPYGVNLSAEQIQMLQTLSPEEFLSTLVHETNHNMLIPFLDQLADAQIIEMHTIVSTASTPTMVGGRQVAATTTATGFRSADQINESVTNFLTKYSNDPRIREAGINDNGIVAYLEDIAKPSEVQARLFEIKKQFANIASKQGQKFEDWMYNFTPETARQGFEAWKGTKARSTVGIGDVEADMFLDLMVGNNTQQKFQTLASILNKTFTNTALIGGTAAVATQADITGTPTQGPGLKRGGYISRKKRGKGFQTKRANRIAQQGAIIPNGDPTKKESTGYARLDARIANMAEDVPSDTTNYTTSQQERLQRQIMAESSGNPMAVSPAGARGLLQIMPATQKDLEDRGFIPRGLDPFNPEHSRQMRDAKINALSELSWIKNPPKKIPEVNRLARIYASYNAGEGRIKKALEKAKADGVDIYSDPRLWFNYIPSETSKYLNIILFN
jgi:hypothetical protein